MKFLDITDFGFEKKNKNTCLLKLFHLFLHDLYADIRLSQEHEIILSHYKYKLRLISFYTNNRFFLRKKIGLAESTVTFSGRLFSNVIKIYRIVCECGVYNEDNNFP